MNSLTDSARRLSLLLWLVAAHSALVGLGLIWHPAGLFGDLGYSPIGESFFPVQGGVFHIVMAIGYAMAANNLDDNRCLVTFAVVVKIMATVFLVSYWLLVDRLGMVLLSGIGDGLMAMLIRVCYVSWRRNSNAGGAR